MRVIIVILALCAVGAVAEDPTCRRAPPPQRGQDTRIALAAGAYRVCVIEGAGTLTLRQCTTETFRVGAAGRETYYLCSRGSVTGRKAWVTNFQGAKVLVTNEAHTITNTYAARTMYANIGCAGFFTSLVLNPNLPATTIEAMFSKLTNCHIQDYIRSQAQARTQSAIALLGDAIGAIPHPAAIITNLVIKAVLTGMNSLADAKEDDWMKFLGVHYTIASIRVRCGGVDGPRVKTCLRRGSPTLSAGPRNYKITFTSCRGNAGGGDYIEVYSDGRKILTTSGGSTFSDGPLAKLCKDGTTFLYTGLRMDPTKRLCFRTFERRTIRSNPQHGETCINGFRTDNSMNIRVGGGRTATVAFQIQAQ